MSAVEENRESDQRNKEANKGEEVVEASSRCCSVIVWVLVLEQEGRRGEAAFDREAVRLHDSPKNRRQASDLCQRVVLFLIVSVASEEEARPQDHRDDDRHDGGDDGVGDDSTAVWSASVVFIADFQEGNHSLRKGKTLHRFTRSRNHSTVFIHHQSSLLQLETFAVVGDEREDCQATNDGGSSGDGGNNRNCTSTFDDGCCFRNVFEIFVIIFDQCWGNCYIINNCSGRSCRWRKCGGS